MFLPGSNMRGRKRPYTESVTVDLSRPNALVLSFFIFLSIPRSINIFFSLCFFIPLSFIRGHRNVPHFMLYVQLHSVRVFSLSRSPTFISLVYLSFLFVVDIYTYISDSPAWWFFFGEIKARHDKLYNYK